MNLDTVTIVQEIAAVFETDRITLRKALPNKLTQSIQLILVQSEGRPFFGKLTHIVCQTMELLPSPEYLQLKQKLP